MHFVWTSYFIACLLALYILIFFFPKPENFNECHFLSLMQYIMLRIHTYNRASVRWNTERKRRIAFNKNRMWHEAFTENFLLFFYYITFFSQAYARFLKWREDFFLLYAIRRNFVDKLLWLFRRKLSCTQVLHSTTLGFDMSLQSGNIKKSDFFSSN